MQSGRNVGEAPVSMRKVAFASFIGTAIEFYDFYIYGTAAALVSGSATPAPGVAAPGSEG